MVSVTLTPPMVTVRTYIYYPIFFIYIVFYRYIAYSDRLVKIFNLVPIQGQQIAQQTWAQPPTPQPTHAIK